MKRIFAFLILSALFVGCAPKSETEKTNPSTSADGGSAEMPKATDSGAAPEGAPKTASGPKATGLPLDSLPASLKHDGYQYYGLGNEQPMEIEVTSSPNGEVLTGTQTTKLMSMEGDKAVFLVERTGGLERLGTAEYTLEPTGIYVKSSTVAKTKGNSLEIPAKLAPGSKWTDTTELEMNGQAMKMTNTYKVIGTQKVTTKKGSFDALVIVTTGKGVVDGKNVRMESKSWYAKGIGNVKTEITMTYPGGDKRSINYQVTG